jgi:hypothetical protein
MSLLDVLTGGADSNAINELNNAQNYIQGIQPLTEEQQQLTPLEQYAQTGVLTPAQMQAAQTGPSAFNNAQVSPAGMEAMQNALAQFQNIASANGMTPQEQAQIAQAQEAMNTNVAGQRGAIAQDFAQRGVPASLISAALQNGTVGQNAQQGYNSALQGQASAANNALTALSNVGSLGGNIQSANQGWASQVANAQNALNQFNTSNVQQSNAANQAANMTANEYNTQTAQNLANQNVAGSQARQYQNQVTAPQTSYEDQLQKGSALAGIAGQEANAYTQQGQQQAGLLGGLLGAGATLGAGYMMGPARAAGVGALTSSMNQPSSGQFQGSFNQYAENNGLNQNQYAPPGFSGSAAAPIPLAEGGPVKPIIPPTPYADGGPAMNFKKGGPVPGHAIVPGNSRVNDVVPAKLSPGEFVMNREQVAQNPNLIQHLMAEKKAQQAPSAHPSDVATVLKALSSLRGTI